MEEEIYIGEKPISRYITTALILGNSGCDRIVLKARGRLIKKAVDVAQILKRQYFPDASFDIEIGTEQVYRRDEPDRVLNVSTIEITLII